MIKEKKETIEAGETYIDSLFALMRLTDLTTEEGQAQAYHFLDMIGQVQQLSKPLQVEEKPAPHAEVSDIWFEEAFIEVPRSHDRRIFDSRLGKAAKNADGHIGLGYWSDGQGFYPTHLVSGLSVCFADSEDKKGFREEATAQKFIESIAPLWNWHQSQKFMKTSPNFGTIASHVLKTFNEFRLKENLATAKRDD